MDPNWMTPVIKWCIKTKSKTELLVVLATLCRTTRDVSKVLSGASLNVGQYSIEVLLGLFNYPEELYTSYKDLPQKPLPSTLNLHLRDWVEWNPNTVSLDDLFKIFPNLRVLTGKNGVVFRDLLVHPSSANLTTFKGRVEGEVEYNLPHDFPLLTSLKVTQRNAINVLLNQGMNYVKFRDGIVTAAGGRIGKMVLKNITLSIQCEWIGKLMVHRSQEILVEDALVEHLIITSHGKDMQFCRSRVQRVEIDGAHEYQELVLDPERSFFNDAEKICGVPMTKIDHLYLGYIPDFVEENSVILWGNGCQDFRLRQTSSPLKTLHLCLCTKPYDKKLPPFSIVTEEIHVRTCLRCRDWFTDTVESECLGRETPQGKKRFLNVKRWAKRNKVSLAHGVLRDYGLRFPSSGPKKPKIVVHE